MMDKSLELIKGLITKCQSVKSTLKLLHAVLFSF